MGTMSVPVVLLLTSLGLVTVECMYCTHYNTSSSSNDPPLPTLPDQYQTTIEANILDRSMSVTAHEYFDSPGDRATLQIFGNNTLHSLVFDYANDQLFYVSDNQCTISNLTTDNNNILFGDVTVKGLPHVFTSGGALHFAKSFGEKYMGNNETVRGIKCDKWRACLYWPQLASNFTLDYYFTARDWLDPISSPAIPVRAHAFGVQIQKDGTLRNFSHFYDYVDFKDSITVDLSIFETPKGVVCLGRKLTKKVPKLPNFYHYRQEIVTAGSGTIFQADVWYDKEYRYIRYDYRTTQERSPLFTLNPITEIHDYNFGVSYTLDQVSGDCISQSISNSSFDVGENTTAYTNGSKLYEIHMKDPMQLFYLDGTYAYTGQRTTRGLLCDVFTSARDDYPIAGIGRMFATFDYYFLADGIKEYPDDGSTTPEDIPIFLEVNVPSLQYSVQYNFLDFDEEHPDLSIFDVSRCFSDTAKLQFQVRFEGKYVTGTSAELSESAQRVFRTIMKVSALRVQDVRVDYDNSQLYISATLLDRSPFTAQFTKLPGKEIEKMDDRVYPISMANNVSSCAKLCVENPGFTCNSFDFCTLDPQNICHLSKAHIGHGKANLINSSCDHFSRTVNGPATQELSISEAYSNLRLQIYNGGVELDAFVTGEVQPRKYVAVDIRVTFGYLNPKPVPSLTGQFSYHEEITIPNLKATFNSHIVNTQMRQLLQELSHQGLQYLQVDCATSVLHSSDCTAKYLYTMKIYIYYDSDYQLVRYDMVNTQPTPPLFSVDPLSTIHDYKSGLAYTLDKAEGNCTIAPIKNNSFDVQFANNPGFVVKMKSPLDIFYLNGTYKYAGQRTIRGMLCDVFEDHRTDFKFGMNPMPSESVFQFYFMSEDWNEMSEDNGAPVNSQPIALVISSAAGEFTMTYNFYDFSEQHPDLSNFDIRPCYAGKQQKHFLIKFQGNYHPTLDTQLKVFTKNVQTELHFITDCSFLRFQDPQITYSDGYVYYLATMVEQAPYLLDFTKTTNRAGISPADKKVPNVNSDMDCATLCRKENTFSCESFDFCPGSNGLCLLRKTHTTQMIGSSFNCDHYSKTVNNVATAEPTVSQAMEMLKNYVYVRGLNITMINPSDNSKMVYHSVVFDQDILRPDSTSTTKFSEWNSRSMFNPFAANAGSVITYANSLDPDETPSNPASHQDPNCVNLDHFIPSMSKVIITADLQLTGLSVDQCAKRCLTEPTFMCQSFDYCFDTGKCLMSALHPDQNISFVHTNMMCDLYARSYLDSYDAYPGQTFQSTGDVQLSPVTSAQLCAKQCSENTNIVCLSFDYCSSTKTCILKHTHILNVPSSAIQNHSVCNHYSRAYIKDFQITPGKELTIPQTLQFMNVTRSACAKICIQNSGANCLSFTFCQSSMTCLIFSVNPAANKQSVQSNTTCDLYTRRNINNNGVPVAHPQTQKSSSSGYSGGAMAGLALGMLIPGMVFGAALLYFCRTKRLVEEEQMRMGFVNMSHENDEFDGPTRSKPDDDLPPAHAHAYDTEITNA